MVIPEAAPLSSVALGSYLLSKSEATEEISLIT